MLAGACEACSPKGGHPDLLIPDWLVCIALCGLVGTRALALPFRILDRAFPTSTGAYLPNPPFRNPDRSSGRATMVIKKVGTSYHMQFVLPQASN